MRALLASLALALIGAGCTQLDVPEGGLGPADFGGPREKPAAVRVALAPVRLAYDARFQEKGPGGKDRDESRAPLALESGELDVAIGLSLGERGRRLFRELAEAPGTEAVEDASGADILLRLRVTRAETRFVGRNGHFAWNVPVLWFWTLFGSWMIGDETYAAEADLAWDATATGTGRVLAGGTVSAVVERDADDFDRGVDLFGLFYLPSSIEEKGWASLGRRFRPFIVRALAERLVESLEAELLPLLRAERLDASLATRYALVLGVAATRDGRVEGAESAEADAAAMAARLEEAGFARANVVVLAGAAASAPAVRAALDGFAARVRPRDALLIYFAGPGRGGADPALVLSDAERASAGLAAGALPLSELERRIGAMRPRSSLVMLDAGFGGDARSLGPTAAGGGGKSAAGAADATRRALDALGRGPGRGLLAAARPGQGAHEVASAGRGTFTYHLLRALEGAADQDRDRRLTLDEVGRWVSSEAEATAGLLGAEQEPFFAGDPETVLPLEPRSAPAPGGA